ncbi:MAG: HAD family phosphatase [Anaerolineae bacterium]|nr:HAD family phosphatase [Anaerolineae bacterium]
MTDPDADSAPPATTRPPIKAIIFDYGGVLMRTAIPALGRQEWEARLGLAEGELERIVHRSELWTKAQRGEISYEDYWNGVASKLRLAVPDVQRLRTDYFRDDHLDQSLIALIRELRNDGYVVGLLSNDTIMLEKTLRFDLNIYDEFDAVLISAKLGVMKPDEGAYYAILSLLNVKPIHAVFIDDNLNNVAAAHYLGMSAIWYRRGLDLRAELSAVLNDGVSFSL